MKQSRGNDIQYDEEGQRTDKRTELDAQTNPLHDAAYLSIPNRLQLYAMYQSRLRHKILLYHHYNTRLRQCQ